MKVPMGEDTPVGPPLDRAIAEHVMHDVPCEEGWSFSSQGWRNDRSCAHARDLNGTATCVPAVIYPQRYSTSTSLAVDRLIPTLGRRGWDCRLHISASSDLVVFVASYQDEAPPGEIYVRAEGRTTAEAICRAALAASREHAAR